MLEKQVLQQLQSNQINKKIGIKSNKKDPEQDLFYCF